MNQILKQILELKSHPAGPIAESLQKQNRSKIRTESVDEMQQYFGYEFTFQSAAAADFTSAAEFILSTETYERLTAPYDEQWHGVSANPAKWRWEMCDPDEEDFDSMIPGEDEYPDIDAELLKLRNTIAHSFENARELWQVDSLMSRIIRFTERVSLFLMCFFWSNNRDRFNRFGSYLVCPIFADFLNGIKVCTRGHQ